MSSKVPIVVAVSLAVATLGAIAMILFTSSSQKESSEIKEVDDLEKEEEVQEETPRISKTQLIKVFQQITAQMERVILRISQVEQQILQKAQQDGQEIDQNELRESMMNEFNNAMKEVEARVYEHLQVSEADVEQATAYFNDDADFQAVLKTLRRKYSLFTGQGVEDVPDYVTMELIMNVMSETMTKMTAAMEEVFHQTKAEHAVGTEAFAQTLQQRYVERIGVIRQKVQKKNVITQRMPE